MEESRNSNLKKICDNANIQCVNTDTEDSIDGTDSQTTAGPIEIQDVKFSKTRKYLKSPQTNTIKTWLKKDSSSDTVIQRKLSYSKLKNIDDDKINKSNKDAHLSSSRDTVIKKEKYALKNTKKNGNVSRKDESAQLHPSKGKDKSKSHTKLRALQEVDITHAKTQSEENMARKKFKSIVTSFTSSLNKKLKVSPQTNIKSNEPESSSSSSTSRRSKRKENVYITPTKQNNNVEPLKKSSNEEIKITPKLKLCDMFSQYDETKILNSSRSRKDNTKENAAVTITGENNSSESLRRSLRTVKPMRKLCGICSCDGTSSLYYKESTEINQLGKVALKCNNCLKPNKSSKIHESSKDHKNGIEDSLNLKPTTIVKSAKSSLDTSVSKKASSSTEKGTWLTKDTGTNRHTKSNRFSKKNISSDSKKEQKSSTKYNQLDVKINFKISRKTKKTRSTLDNFVVKSPKNSSKRKFSRSESSESCELPSFVKTNKKVKTSGGSDSFKKYGVAVPSVEEILKEQRDLVQYKNQVESFKDIDDKFFELPFSVEDLKANKTVKTNILDCKHLSNCEIEEAFQKNLDHISDIFHGKEYNERHERFFKGNVKSHTFTIKDLCYSTSTIVFSFEQKELLLSLLRNKFDPDDKKTLYFFQVLLPELCLKIFMSTHNMTHDEAVKYLDTRPIVD